MHFLKVKSSQDWSGWFRFVFSCFWGGCGEGDIMLLRGTGKEGMVYGSFPGGVLWRFGISQTAAGCGGRSR